MFVRPIIALTAIIGSFDGFALAEAESGTHIYHRAHQIVSHMRQSTDGHWLQVEHRVHDQDLGKALATWSAQVFDTPVLTEDEIILIGQYVTARFQVAPEGDNTPGLNYVGAERENDHIWIYQERAWAPNMTSLIISNTLLMEAFADQHNQVSYFNGEQAQTVHFRPGSPSARLELSPDPAPERPRNPRSFGAHWQALKVWLTRLVP